MVTSIKGWIEILWTLSILHNRVSGWRRQGWLRAYVGTAALCKREASSAADHNRATWCWFIKGACRYLRWNTSWVASIFAVSSDKGRGEGQKSIECVCVCIEGVAVDAAEHRGAVLGGWITKYTGPACHPCSDFLHFLSACDQFRYVRLCPLLMACERARLILYRWRCAGPRCNLLCMVSDMKPCRGLQFPESVPCGSLRSVFSLNSNIWFVKWTRVYWMSIFSLSHSLPG